MNDRELLEEAYNIYKEDFLSLPRPIVQGHDATYKYVAQQRPEVPEAQAGRIHGPEYRR
jgi:hypothetical protein